jgi:hypothetical protein
MGIIVAKQLQNLNGRFVVTIFVIDRKLAKNK